MVKVYISGTDDMRMGETSYGDDKGRYVYRKITNADRIRAMSDEELADFLYETETQYIPIDLLVENNWLEWLESEVE